MRQELQVSPVTPVLPSTSSPAWQAAPPQLKKELGSGCRDWDQSHSTHVGLRRAEAGGRVLISEGCGVRPGRWREKQGALGPGLCQAHPG